MVLINGTPSIARTLTYEQTGFSSHHFITGRETDRQTFEYLTVAAVRIDNPDLAPGLIDHALTQCITEKRPVYIELLQDMVDLECEPPKGTLKPARDLSDEANVAASVARINERLAAAANPLLWVGVEIDRLGLQDKVSALIRQLNIPFVTELLGKAVLSENDALFVGVLDGQASSAAVMELTTDCDFMLALGVWLTDLNSLGWSPDYDKTAFVSWDTVKHGTYFSPEVSLERLIDGLLASPVTAKTSNQRRTQAQTAAAVGSADDEITYDGFYDVIHEHIDEHTIVGSDASLNYFGSLLLKVPSAGGFVAQASYSAIGYIGPAATGMSLAKSSDQRVMVFAGDGGFQMTAQCLSTQTRFNLNPMIFVINNGVYGVEQWLADASVFATDKPFYKSCILHPWNYSKLSDVFGCQGWKVSTYGELGEAISCASAIVDGPSIIEVVVAGKSIPSNATWKAR